MLTRRGLLARMLSVGMSPAIVRADSLMRLPTRVPKLCDMEIGRIEGLRMSAGGIYLMPDRVIYEGWYIFQIEDFLPTRRVIC